MNAIRFTAIARSLTAATTRRDLSRGLAGLALGGALSTRAGPPRLRAGNARGARVAATWLGHAPAVAAGSAMTTARVAQMREALDR
jgi:hypothetical protein